MVNMRNIRLVADQLIKGDEAWPVCRYKRGQINLRPDYQRGYVWDKKKASKLIVTVLNRRLVPQIVLHEKHDQEGVYDVVDGKQRLTAMLCFYR